MSFSNYLENQMLDHILGNSVYTPPTRLWVGLGVDSTDSAANELVEIYMYFRVQTGPSTWIQPDPTIGRMTNALEVTFEEATGDWGPVTHFLLFDSGVRGASNYLMYGELTGEAATIVVEEGSVPKFEAGALVITYD